MGVLLASAVACVAFVALAVWLPRPSTERCAHCAGPVPRVPFGSDQHPALWCSEVCQLLWETTP